MVLFIEILIIFVLCLWFYACRGEPLFVFSSFFAFFALNLLLYYRFITGGWFAL